MILVLWNFIYRILQVYIHLYSQRESVGFQSLGPGTVDTKMHAPKNRNSPGTLLEAFAVGLQSWAIYSLCLQEIDRNAAPCNCKHVTLPSVFQSLNDLAQRLQSVTCAITSDLAKCLSKLDI